MPSVGCSTARTKPFSGQNSRSVVPRLLGRRLHDQPALAAGADDARVGAALAGTSLGLADRFRRGEARRGRRLVAVVVGRRRQIGRDLERRRGGRRLVVDLLARSIRQLASSAETSATTASASAVRSDGAASDPANCMRYSPRLIAGSPRRAARRGRCRDIASRAASAAAAGRRSDQSHLRQRPFHRDRIRFDEQIAMQRQQAIVGSRARSRYRRRARRCTSVPSAWARRWR